LTDPPARLAALPLLFGLGCAKIAPPDPPSAAAAACGPGPDGSARLMVLHINDVYRYAGRIDGSGGLPRVRSLREALEARCGGPVLLTHGGDLLYPSLESGTLGGAQMVGLMNLLDGDPTAADPHLVVTIGNHEFDKAKAADAPGLAARFAESQFRWLDTSVRWTPDPAHGDGLFLTGNTHERVLVELHGVKVGVFGLTWDSRKPAYAELLTDWQGIARAQSAALRAEGAQLVIGLTHLPRAVDAALLEALGPAGPDLILGGHDHVASSALIGGRPLLKADADALTARVLHIEVNADGRITWLDGTDAAVPLAEHAPAPLLVQAAAEWDARFRAAWSEKAGRPAPFDEVLTHAAAPLIAEEDRIRRYETNVGDAVTDLMRATFPGAQVAFLNSGSLRLNQDVAAGTALTERVVEELLPYGSPLFLIELSGAELQAALDRSVAEWEGNGHWLQVSGLVFRHDVQAGAAADVHLIGPDGALRPLRPDERVRAVTGRYLLDRDGDQDGYRMLGMQQVVDHPANGSDLKDLLRATLKAAGPAGWGPAADGRICSTDRPADPCQLPGAGG
jgi:2',3'-cyclic-nucleotide 2'-phosphodiesterase (5'-nucleotidase family)